jgi:hypothetical protein
MGIWKENIVGGGGGRGMEEKGDGGFQYVAQ